MMIITADFPSASAARIKFKDVLDASSQGRAVTIQRAHEVFAVVPMEDLRASLAASIRPRTEVAVENGVWVGAVPGLPIAAEGEDLDDLAAELVQALREYAQDWDDRLRRFPNHQQNRPLVQLVRLSTDDQLANWLASE
jgi:hypothetical protein